MGVRSVCRALLVLDLAYCAAAVAVPELPGWKMFTSSERADSALWDGNGRAVDPYAWVPKSARDLDDGDVLRVARWLCERRDVALPLRLDTRGVRRIIEAPGCGDRAVE